jgi:CheR methyltransferase, SAM binding domain
LLPAAFSLCLCAFVSLCFHSGLARNSFTDYNDVQQVLASLADTLPPQLRSSDLSTRPRAWRDWVTAHDRDIRRRLSGGDEDTIVNWLLFGTSFTQESRVFFEVSATSDWLRRLISRRTKDLISVLASPDTNERAMFARQLLLSKGYRFETMDEQLRLEQHLYAEVDRVVAERQQYQLREGAFPAGDVVGQIMAESTLFRDRGLSLDTSILPSFAIEEALKTMRNQGLLPPKSIRRVAVVGPGLDFADKNSGYDFYPVQTLQPFTSIDSLSRLGLAAGPTEIDVTTFDISDRVNDHILAIQHRAKNGSPYVLRLPIDRGSQWTPALVTYWKSIGDRIGSETRLPRPLHMGKGLELRGIEVRPQVAVRVQPIDFNVVTEKWTGPPFDLVIATNVLVYYDKLDQLLAFASIEGMLRPGGFFLTNNAIVELPAARLRSVGVITVQHSPQNIDHVFCYRRTEQ